MQPEKKDHLLSDASSDLSHCHSSESSDSSLSSDADDFVSKNAQNRKRVGSYKSSPTDSSQELMEPITHSHFDYDMIDLK